MAIVTVGIDLGKHVFAVHGVGQAGKAELERRAALYQRAQRAAVTGSAVARASPDWFCAPSTGGRRHVQLQREGQALELDVPARFVTTDSAAALSAGLDGLGIVQLAEFVAGHYLARGALVPLLPGWQCPRLPLHLVTPTTRKRTARVQAFMEWAHALLLRRLGAHLDLR